MLPVGKKGASAAAKAADRHGLKHDPARPGDDGVEQPLSAEQDVFHASDGLDINGAGGIAHGQIAGIHHHLLAGS